MKNEMDMMNMDERQRFSWLLANRLALIFVGLIWLGLIGWELYNCRIPWVMIFAVPLIALFRFLIYLYYIKRKYCFWDES